MLIKLWMHQNPVTINKETSLSQAQEIIKEQNFRHLPVVEGDILIGIVTQTDIDKALPSALDSTVSAQDRIIATHTKASSFMTENPITARPMDSLERVALLMQKFKIGALPVVEDESCVGIITETDIFKAFTELSGIGNPGVRIELQISKNKSSFYAVMEICRQFDMDLGAVALHRNFSHNQQLLTIRVNGENMDDMIETLWSSGAKITQVNK